MELGASQRPGGRSERVRRAVLDATLELILERGLDQLSIVEVAGRAGVHDTTIYRRWGTRERLMIDALLVAGERRLPVPDTGSLRGDLVEFASTLASLLSEPLGRALAHALAGPSEDPAMNEARAHYFQARLDLVGVVIDRAVARGELPAGTDASLALEALIAPLHFRTLVSRRPLDDGLPGRIADLVLYGLTVSMAEPSSDTRTP
jgi:AcrR family transcriptional regulator